MVALKVGHIYDFSFILEYTHLVHPSRWQQEPWSLGLAPWGFVLTFPEGPGSHCPSGGLDLKPEGRIGDFR